MRAPVPDQVELDIAAPAVELEVALALAKRSFNADSENIRGISQMALNAVKLFYDTEESKEGVRAFTEKRKPDFHKYVK